MWNPNLLSQTGEATPGGTRWARHAPSPWSVSPAAAPRLPFSSSAPLEEKTIFLSGSKASSLGWACADPTGLSPLGMGRSVGADVILLPYVSVSISQAREGGQALWTRRVYIPAGFSISPITCGQIRGDSWALRAPESSGSGQIGSESHSPRKHGRKSLGNHLPSCHR